MTTNQTTTDRAQFLEAHRRELDDMTRGYATAALWADCMPPEGDDDGESGGREGLTMEPDALEAMREFCADFMIANLADLEVYADAMDRSPEWTGWEMAGHDLRLTAGGHGVGFWDRENVDTTVRTELNEAAQNVAVRSDQLTPVANADGETAGVFG